MSEQGNTASPRNNPHWLMGESDLLRFDRQRGEEKPVYGPRSAGSRARMPPASGSGYEQILAARGELRVRADRAAAYARHAPAEPATPPAAAARPSLERPPPRALRFDRRDRPALVVWGLLTAPAACVLVAFAWAGPPRSPVSPVAALQASQAPLAMADTRGVAAPSPVSGEWATFSSRDLRMALRPDDAEPVPPTAPLLREGMRPHPATDVAEAESHQGDAPVLAGEPSSTEMLPEEVQAAFTTWDQQAAPRSADAEPDASQDAAAELVGSEPVPDPRDRDAPIADAASGAAAQEDGGAPPPAAASATADAGPAGGASMAAEAAMEVAHRRAPPADPMPEGAAEPAARDGTGGVPASADSDSPEAGQQASTPRPDPAGQTSPAAESNTGKDAIAGAAASSGGPAADASAKVPRPPRVAALVAPPPSPAALPPADDAPPARPRPGGSPPTAAPRPAAAARDAPPASPPPDPRCRAIVVKAQLGEETSHAERLLLRSGCRAAR